MASFDLQPLWRTPLLCLLGVLIVAPSCRNGPQRLTPVARRDAPLARDVHRADVLGLVPTAALSSGYSRRIDLARSLHDAREKRVLEDAFDTVEPEPDSSQDLDADESWFRAILAEHEPAIDDVWEDDFQAFYIEPLDGPRLRLLYVDEEVQFQNERGREFADGANLYLSNRVSARFLNRFLITAEPELSVVEHAANVSEDSQTVLRMQELTAAARLGPVELTAGRTPLWWGPGRHGSLLLSDNVRPFDLVKIGTAGPQLLPGFLEHLGLVQAELFATRLESARAVRRPYFAGMRVSSRILPFLEVGASRTAQFGGGDRSITARTIWEVVTADTENDEDDPGNQLASIDARVVVPWQMQPFEIYGELGGEDEAGGFFSKNAALAGLYLPRIGPWHRLELNIEWADTSIANADRVWYTNRNFPDGYTFHDRIVGHHVGTDGRDLYFELRVHLSERLEALVSYDYEEHLREDPVVERLHQVRLGLRARVWKGLEISGRVGLDRWNNFRQVQGQSETGHFIELGTLWHF